MEKIEATFACAIDGLIGRRTRGFILRPGAPALISGARADSSE
jgi:hypothetical protein